MKTSILPRGRVRSVQLAVIGVACILGIGSRRYGANLPGFVVDYAGDTLWAMAAFFAIGLLLPRASTRFVAALALGFSIAVELAQLYHAPWIDAIRGTTIGGLLFGYEFVWSDVCCYAAGVALAGGLDLLLKRA